MTPINESESGQLPEHLRLREDAKFSTGKIAIFQYLAMGIFILLIVRFWDLQVRNPGIYHEMAEQNRVRAVPVPAARGKILDRDGRVIVDNHSSYSLLLNRESYKPEHLRAICDGLDLDYAQIQSKLEKFRKRPSYEPIIIKQELTADELAFVDSHRDPETFPELMVIRAQRRLYPKDGLAAHVIGYVGEVSEIELDSSDFAHYQQGQIIGKDGLERQYNDSLMGVDGQRRVMVDVMGRERQVLDDKPAVPGRDLETTLDLDLEAVAELSLGDRPGAVVAMDPRNGDVLAMVSRPTYDPSLFAAHIRPKDWNALLLNPQKPLLNRAVQAQLAPGSTFKPVMAMAGLETGTIEDGYHVHCPGGASFYGHWYACHLKHGHGDIELHRAIEQSCDVYFYNVGYKLGIDRIAHYADMVGFGHKTGIDLPHEAEGVVPSTQWALKNYHRKWYAGETISVAIGQGALTVTPIQLAYAISGIAMGGVWHKPHLVRDPVHPVAFRKIDFHTDNISKVVYGMWGVVNEYGTGGRARLPGISVCGKTGTAQVASAELAKAMQGSHLAANFANNAWFVGFAPRENPEIVVVALLQGGGESTVAVPVVRDVLKAYFDKKARQSQPLPMLAELPRLSIPTPTPKPPSAPAAAEPDSSQVSEDR